MPNFRFIHAADLHIESPYKGVSQIKEELGTALLKFAKEAYDNLIQTCIDQKVDFLLIAGDSFDSGSASLKAQYHFVAGLRKLSDENIKVFIICGNHDPLNSWLKSFKLPENVYLFDKDEVERKSFIKEGKEIGIYGCSFLEREENRNLAATYQRQTKDSFSIGILHGMLDGKDGHDPYCPFTINDLRASKMDYWALGHIHKREVILEDSPLAIYPGNLQGRHFNETGEKGCYLIEVAQNHIQSKEFISLSKVIFEKTSINISKVQTLEELEQTLREYTLRLLNQGTSVLLRLELEGESSLFKTLQEERSTQDLLSILNEDINYQAPFVFIDRLINQTSPIVNLEERAKSNDFIARLLENFSHYENHEEALQTLGLNIFERIKGKQDSYYLKEAALSFDDLELLRELIETAKYDSISGLIQEKE